MNKQPIDDYSYDLLKPFRYRMPAGSVMDLETRARHTEHITGYMFYDTFEDCMNEWLPFANSELILPLQTTTFVYKSPNNSLEWSAYLAGCTDSCELQSVLMVHRNSRNLKSTNMYHMAFFFPSYSYLNLNIKSFFNYNFKFTSTVYNINGEEDKLFFVNFINDTKSDVKLSELASPYFTGELFIKYQNKLTNLRLILILLQLYSRNIATLRSLENLWDNIILQQPDVQNMKNDFEHQHTAHLIVDSRVQLPSHAGTYLINDAVKRLISATHIATYFGSTDFLKSWYLVGLFENSEKSELYFTLNSIIRKYSRHCFIDTAQYESTQFEFKITFFSNLLGHSIGYSYCKLVVELRDVFGCLIRPMWQGNTKNHYIYEVVIKSLLGINKFLNYLDEFPPLTEGFYYSYYYFRSAFLLIQNIRLRENNAFKPTPNELLLLQQYELNLKRVKTHYSKKVRVNNFEEWQEIYEPQWLEFDNKFKRIQT